MRPLEPLLADLTSYASDPNLVRVVLNATSWIEASLAVGLLAETTPEKVVVTAANIREAIKQLPRCPMSMALDIESLAVVWHLTREGMGWARSFEDPDGDYSLVLLGEGNYCYDIVVRTEERSLMWMPVHQEDDYLNPEVIDLLLERRTLLGNVIDLLEAMGMPFYPLFYFSLEDWRQEYAQTIFDEVVRVFGIQEAEEPEHVSRGVAREVQPHGTEIRVSGSIEDDGVNWVL